MPLMLAEEKRNLRKEAGTAVFPLTLIRITFDTIGELSAWLACSPYAACVRDHVPGADPGPMAVSHVFPSSVDWAIYTCSMGPLEMSTNTETPCRRKFPKCGNS